MICYRDMTFCSRGEGCTCPEFRRLTVKVWADAERWWGKPNPPVSMAVLCQPKTLPDPAENFDRWADAQQEPRPHE